MSQSNIKQVLTDLGLSETETRVYLAMLKLGPNSVQNIAKKSGVSRTAAYELIGSLQKKGLTSTFQKGKKTMFSVEDPDNLQSYFKGRLTQMKGQLGTLKRLVPELRVMHGGDNPRVRFYQGEEGVRALFRDVHSLNVKELLEVGNADIVYETLNEKVLLQLRRLEGFKNIKARSLFAGTLRNVHPGATFRKLDQKFSDFKGNIWVYKNRIAYVMLVGDIEVVIIENEIFADTMRAVFNQAWESAEKPKK